MNIRAQRIFSVTNSTYSKKNNFVSAVTGVYNDNDTNTVTHSTTVRSMADGCEY